MSGISSKVLNALRNWNRYGLSWAKTKADHWTTDEGLALVLVDKMKDDPYICPDCAQEGWVMTDTQDPDIWAETVDYPDVIESPNHYTIGEREAIDYMRDMGVLEDYAAGNIFKYLYRYKYKDNPTGDLLKARRYIDILIEELNNAE
jgi:hypothetical protein